ncbi:SRPBCC family protein [Streptomyces montanisoli]|uniref:SRPBCC family protein n=1 Tax=Streptomyces montanisoli TaxID=2798581 RepID=A0A940MKE0_9ACTN|nr:SRPBCC family protein [Streptomyces montanisoli]MBP0461382.1 SRPBCC family protein [Streptomyces montanisoli]
MTDATPGTLREEIAGNPEVGRLKEEVRDYLVARATHTVTGLGRRLGGDAERLADTGADDPEEADEGKDGGDDGGKSGGGGGNGGGGGSSGGGSSGGGSSKSNLICEDVDVGVPVRVAYDQWTQFEEFPSFAKGVVNVDTEDDAVTNWQVKVAKSNRSFKATITEQIPDERIAWRTEGDKGTVKGVVTFHPLGDRLTRVLLVLEYFPQGFFEKTGNIWRAQGRRTRLDLKLFRKFVMMSGEATDAWRGEIRDGEVVVDHKEAVEREREQQDADSEPPEDEDEDAYDDENEDEPEEDDEEDDDDLEEPEDEEYEDDEDDEEEDDEEDEYEDDEEDEEPVRPARRRATASRR